MGRQWLTMANDGPILAGHRSVRADSPPRALGLLLVIGLADLVATVVLHAQGAIEERNPLMALPLARSEWDFVAVKLITLVLAAILMARQARVDPVAVRRACLAGSGVYLALWVAAFSLR